MDAHFSQDAGRPCLLYAWAKILAIGLIQGDRLPL